MKSGYETHATTWEGIALQVRWNPNWCNVSAHMEIESADRVPLPITETGYRSHFTPREQVECWGGPVEYAHAWLDQAARDPAWIDAREKARQGDLFA